MNSTEKSILVSSLTNVVATKLAPQTRRGYIRRDVLTEKLSDVLRHRLTLVHGAAGYGKSSLLTQWYSQLQSSAQATIWLTLEEEEGNTASLIRHLLMACINSGYVASDVMDNIGIVDEKISIKALMTIMINAIAVNSQPLVVFLDEYNRIQSSETNDFMRVLIRNLPNHVHFVIASRWRPHIDLENLRAHGDLLEVTTADLRFSLDESAALLDLSDAHLQQNHSQPNNISQFLEFAEGWPIALQMLRLWMQRKQSEASDLLQSSSALNKTNVAEVTHYLSEQVLSDLAEEEKYFLMRISVLERVNGDLANHLTGRTDGWLLLEQFYEHNLFIESLGTDRKWFRFHAVFVEYLRQRLQRYEPQIIQELHTQAARWFEANGKIRLAFEHALQTQTPSYAAQILSRAGGWRMVMDGRIEIFQNALKKLDYAIIAEFPRLLLGQVFTLIKNGEIDEARRAFAEINVDTSWSDQDRIDYKVISITLSYYADERVSLEEIHELEQLQSEVSRRDHLIMALLSDSLAEKCYALRQFDRALEACADAASHYRIQRSLYGEMFIRFKQVQVHLAQGRLDEAESHLRHNHKEIHYRLGDETDLAAHNAVFLAENLLEKNAIEEAQSYLKPALEKIEQADGWFELYASAYLTATALAWREHGMDGVETELKRARRTAQTRFLWRLELLADSEAVFYLCLNGEHKLATRYISRLAIALNSEQPPYHYLSGRLAASLAIYYISENQLKVATELLQNYATAAQECQDIRQYISLTLLQAIIAFQSNDTNGAMDLLDKAVQTGLFRGFKQAYIGLAYWLLPLLNFALSNEDLLPADRYRTEFLQLLKREMKHWEKSRLKDERALTLGEIDVLRELDHGYSNKQIARNLGISPNTVKYRLKSIFVKYSVSKRTDLVRLVREEGRLTYNDTRH